MASYILRSHVTLINHHLLPRRPIVLQKNYKALATGHRYRCLLVSRPSAPEPCTKMNFIITRRTATMHEPRLCSALNMRHLSERPAMCRNLSPPSSSISSRFPTTPFMFSFFPHPEKITEPTNYIKRHNQTFSCTTLGLHVHFICKNFQLAFSPASKPVRTILVHQHTPVLLSVRIAGTIPPTMPSSHKRTFDHDSPSTLLSPVTLARGPWSNTPISSSHATPFRK